MKKITICTLIILTLGISNVEVVLAKNSENDLKYKIDNIEEISEDKEKNKEDLQEESTVKKQTEEVKENNKLRNKEESVQPSGWTLINNRYFYIEKNGSFKKGWYNDGYDWYHLDNNTGEMTTGWYFDGYDYYYLNDNGVMATGWYFDGYDYYYLNNNGTMATGWKEINGDWYYLESNGTMVTGYKTINGTRYYFDNSGKMDIGLGIVVEARKHIGKRYVSGGNGPNAFDCSGLTKYVYNEMGINLNRTTYDQVKQGRYVSRDELKPGDLVFSHGPANSPGHVGIYSGNGKYVHAANSREGVIESLIYGYTTARRIIE